MALSWALGRGHDSPTSISLVSDLWQQPFVPLMDRYPCVLVLDNSK